VVSRWSALAVLVAGAACSSYSGTGSVPVDGGADATPASDAAPENDSSTPDADAASEAGAPNLLENGDFESGCARWTASQGSATADTTARSGAGSCRLCFAPDPDSGAMAANLYQIVPHTLTSGTRYGATAWVRNAPGTSGASSAYSRIIEHDNTGTAYPSSGTPFTPNDTWQRTDALLDLPADGSAIEFAITASGGCILVDDASLSQE
jgi:hypothetical protein